MVNYCCVYGCGRNSRTSKHLYFYSVPMDLIRSEQWLKAARREDLLEKPKSKRNLYRFCSRHFSPQSIKNKHLCADAVPTLYLPGCEVDDDNDDRPMHSNIACNKCQSKIVGFRYKCVTCVDFDLCARCEMAEAHEEHLMLRIPSPMKFKKVEQMVKKWQQYHSEENNYSSDDEPIQKYAKNYDSGIDLSDDIKETIRSEVARVLKVKKTDTKKKTSKSVKRTSEADKNPKKQKMSFVDIGPFSSVPEVAFADVNEIHTHSNVTNQTINVKNEAPCIFPGNSEGSEKEILHKFPNPDKEIERFRTWLHHIGGDILKLDNNTIFKLRRVCHLHFKSCYHTRSKFLSVDAVPCLNLQASDPDLPVMNLKLTDDLSDLIVFNAYK